MAEKEVRLNLKATSSGTGLKDAAQDSQKLENSVRDLRQELAKSNQRFEEAKATSIQLRAEWKKMDRSGSYSKEQMDEQSRAIEKASTAQLAAIRSSQKLVGEVRELGDETGITANSLDIFSSKLQESERYVTGVGGAAKLAADKSDAMRQSIDKTTTSIDRMGDEVRGTNQTLDKIDDSTSKATGALNRMGTSVNNARESLSKIEKQSGIVGRAMGNILADTIQDAAQAFVEFAKISYESFRSFDDEARRVFAQVPGMSAKMRDSLAGDAKVIASQIGRVPQETLPALRKALNLGISEDNLFSSIETASMAARVGGESLIDTMVLGQSVVNAYGGEMYSLADAYDQLNFITQSSNLEFGDLNANMNEIISAAAEAGIGLESVAGAMVTMNRQGDDAAEIAGLLSNVLTQISIEGTALGMAFKDAAGIGFRDFTAAGGTLSEGLQILQQHAQDTGQDLLNMVGGSSPFYRDVQAARGVLELTGKHAAALAENTAAAAKATGGLAAAAAEFADSPALTYDRAAASVENLKLATGGWLAQLAEGIGLIEGTNLVAQLLSGTLSHQVKGQVNDILAAAEATGEYAEAYKQLSDAQQSGITFGLDEPVNKGLTHLLTKIAEGSKDASAFKAELDRVGIAVGNMSDPNDVAALEAFFTDVQIAQTKKYYEALGEVDYWQSEVATSTGLSRAEIFAFNDAMQGGVNDLGEWVGQTKEAREATFGFNDAMQAQQARIQGVAEWYDKMTESEAAAIAAAKESFGSLTSTIDGLKGVISSAYGDDAISAEESSKRIAAANEAIAGSYKDTALAIVQARLAQVIEADGLQAAQAMITLQAELGLISADAAAELHKVAKETDLVTSVTNEMLDTYLADGYLTRVEVENLATAVSAVGTNATLTKDQIIELANTGTTSAIAITEGVYGLEQGLDDTLLSVGAVKDGLYAITEGSPWESEAITDTGDTKERLGAIVGMLNGLDGRRTNSTHTHTTVNETRNQDNKEGDKSTAGAKPQYSGGPMWPGQAYLVGDTASGNPTPYSEVIIPQQPMMNLGVQGSKGMMGGGQTINVQLTNHFYMNAETANLDELFETQERSLYNAAQSIGIPL